MLGVPVGFLGAGAEECGGQGQVEVICVILVLNHC